MCEAQGEAREPVLMWMWVLVHLFNTCFFSIYRMPDTLLDSRDGAVNKRHKAPVPSTVPGTNWVFNPCVMHEDNAIRGKSSVT